MLFKKDSGGPFNRAEERERSETDAPPKKKWGLISCKVKAKVKGTDSKTLKPE